MFVLFGLFQEHVALQPRSKVPMLVMLPLFLVWQREEHACISGAAGGCQAELVVRMRSRFPLTLAASF